MRAGSQPRDRSYHWLLQSPMLTGCITGDKHWRHAAVATSSGHRHEFAPWKHVDVDEKASLQLLRTLRPGKTKAALELVLSGGMLTGSRTNRTRGHPYDLCPAGCQEVDDDVHRFWRCPRWNRSRAGLEVSEATHHHILSLTSGWFPQGHEHDMSHILRCQRHMIRVVLDSTSDFHQRRRDHFRPGHLEDDHRPDLGEEQDEQQDQTDDDLDMGVRGNHDSDNDDGDHDDDHLRNPRPDDNERARRIRGDSGVGALPEAGMHERHRAPPRGDARALPMRADRDGVGGGWNRARPPRVNGRMEDIPLPAHVHKGVRRLRQIPGYERGLLLCKNCGAVGAQMRTQQFLNKHTVCVGTGDAPPGYAPLTVFERRLIQEAGYEVPPPAKKRKGVPRAVPVSHSDEFD